MPFSLRSDEELVAEAQRALEALGVEVVIDSASSSVKACADRQQLWDASNKAVISTSRVLKESIVAGGSVAYACAFLLAPLASKTSVMASPILRNRVGLEAGAAVAWWHSM